MLHKNPIAQGAAAVLDTSVTNVTNSAYVQLISAANKTKPSTDIIIYNGGAQPLQVATGGAGSEVDSGLIAVPGATVIVPFEVAASTRLSLKALGTTSQSTGFVTAIFLG